MRVKASLATAKTIDLFLDSGSNLIRMVIISLKDVYEKSLSIYDR